MDIRAGDGSILFQNIRKARRVRWMMLGAVIFAVIFVYLAVDVLRSYGLAPTEGGVLRPWGERWPLATLLMVVAVAPLGGIVFYAGLYLVRIERRAATLILSTIGPFGIKVREVDAGTVSSVRFHDWELEPGSSVSTPWLSVRLSDRRAPLIADLGADYVDRRAIERLADARGR